MSKKAGYRTITYRFRLYCERMDWLVETKNMYNKVLAFYYDVLGREPELWNTPKLKMMRQLELLTVGAREDLEEDVKYPIPFAKVPLYFRRAAINDAIRLHASFRAGADKDAKMAEDFDASPIYYKGMYKEFTSTSVRLKVFNGDKWCWVDCSIDTCGRRMPLEEQMMSPVIVLEKGRAMLHVPVKEEVEDVRTVKERMPEAEKICAVYFPNSDIMAVLVLLSAEGEFLESRFIHGGSELAHRKRVILERIRRNRESMGGNLKELPADENKALKEKIHRMTDDAAHKVSREIVEFCKEHGAGVIAVPKYHQTTDAQGAAYLAANSYDWLGRRIISYVKYKSFGEGIVTATVSTKDISSRCYLCGERVKKYSGEQLHGKKPQAGKNYMCPGGHSGNSYFNAAMNIGRRFLKQYGVKNSEMLSL